MGSSLSCSSSADSLNSTSYSLDVLPWHCYVTS